jgi:hypothetical protein
LARTILFDPFEGSSLHSIVIIEYLSRVFHSTLVNQLIGKAFDIIPDVSLPADCSLMDPDFR